MRAPYAYGANLRLRLTYLFLAFARFAADSKQDSDRRPEFPRICMISRDEHERGESVFECVEMDFISQEATDLQDHCPLPASVD